MVTVEYWSICLKDLSQAAALFELLSEKEKGRSQRFKFPELQQRFILGRGALRQILGFYLEQDPTNIQFHYGKYGKPFVEGIVFNFSHTKELACCAIAVQNTSVQLGIDLEIRNRNIKVLDLAERFFHPSEYQALQQISHTRKIDYFLQLWTAKEAYLKARGTGLQGGLDQVIVRLEDQPYLELQSFEPWSLKNFQPNPDHWAAIAVDDPNCELLNRGEWLQ